MINKQYLHKLLHPSSNVNISILGPTHRYGHQVTQGHDALTLKNNLKEARNRLKRLGWAEEKIHQFLKPARELLYDDHFWQHQSDGLAIYLSENFRQIHRLPVHFHNMVYVNEDFYLKPLSPFTGAKNRFFILCLSQNEVAFYEATAYSITSIKIDDLVPESMEAMGVAEGEKVLQSHAVMTGHPAQYHGHGGFKDHQEVAREKYLRAIDKGLMTMLHDEHAPMVVAAVDELAAAYEAVNSYPHLVADSVSGNPFSMGMTAIQAHAWEEVKPHFAQEKHEAMANYHRLQNSEQTSTNIGEILYAAEEGRVDTIFTRDDSNLWGRYVLEEDKVTLHPERTSTSHCLLNKAMIKTLKNSGHVYNLPPSQMPSDDTSPIAALFRY